MPAGPPDRMPWADVPVLIVVCSEATFGRSEAGVAAIGASIYPAVQNLLFGGAALGLGTVMTTRWKAREPEVRENPRPARKRWQLTQLCRWAGRTERTAAASAGRCANHVPGALGQPW